MDTTWLLAHKYTKSCNLGYGIDVSVQHGLVVMSDFYHYTLDVHSLTDGSLVRRIGGQGDGKGQFDFLSGGLCVTPDGNSVLVAEFSNNRVQQVSILDGSWMRFIGEGVLKKPDFVDCNADVVVVSESWNHRISVLSWADDSMRAQFGSLGNSPGQLRFPCGIRLLADGSGLVVADNFNNRLCVFALSGEFVAAVGSGAQGLNRPYDVRECALDGSFVVGNSGCHTLTRLSRDGSKVETFGKKGKGNGDFKAPVAFAALPDGGMVVREYINERFQVFRSLELRKAWVTVCVAVARYI
jgi:DNA-binding beta-propeller fold protein YncE